VVVVVPSAGIDPVLTEKVELLVFALAKTGEAKRREEKKTVQIKTKTLFFIWCISFIDN
jgi:hypothetical protein